MGEPFSNSLRAQRVGVPGGIVTAAVMADGTIVRVEVRDGAATESQSCVPLTVTRKAAEDFGWCRG